MPSQKAAISIDVYKRQLAHVGKSYAVSAARADELKLKDGSTVVGTIVGFEERCV